jgi:hypothetical protein
VDQTILLQAAQAERRRRSVPVPAAEAGTPSRRRPPGWLPRFLLDAWRRDHPGEELPAFFQELARHVEQIGKKMPPAS